MRYLNDETVFEPDLGLLTSCMVEYQINIFFKRGSSSVSYAQYNAVCQLSFKLVHRVGRIYKCLCSAKSVKQTSSDSYRWDC